MDCVELVTVAMHDTGEGGDGGGDDGVQGNGAPADAEHFADDDDFDELYGDTQQQQQLLATEVPAADADPEGDDDVEVEVMAARDDDARANGAVAEGAALRTGSSRL